MVDGLSEGNVALSGQQSADKKQKEKRALTGATCYGGGKHGHLQRSCPTKWDEKSSTQGEASSAKKPPSGTLYTAVAQPQYPRKKDSPIVSTSIWERPTTSFRRRAICVPTENSSSLLR